MIHNLTNKITSLKCFILVVSTMFFFNISVGQNLKKIINNSSSSPLPSTAPSSSDNYMEFEAEYFEKQTETSKRSWYLSSNKITPKVKKDPDENHYKGSSGLTYLELLPDTLYDDRQKKVDGKNYSRTPGTMATLTYNVDFKEAGKYYVWVRGYATSGYDNSMHVGIDNQWPDSAKSIYLCNDKMNKWSWSSDQFVNDESCRKRNKKRIFIDVKKPGKHKIMFCMREDGFEFDKWALTKNSKNTPL